jgi:hypothetical protein
MRWPPRPLPSGARLSGLAQTNAAAPSALALPRVDPYVVGAVQPWSADHTCDPGGPSIERSCPRHAPPAPDGQPVPLRRS